MKKIIISLLILAMALSLVACGTPKPKTSDTEEVPTKTEDQLWYKNIDYSEYDYSLPFDNSGYFKGVDALEYVELCDYQNIIIPKDVTDISEEDIQSQIDSLCANYSHTDKIYDKAVADGDTVNIDYVGSVDGEEFEGGNTQGEGTDVIIGVTSYIDDFLEQLIGHMPGETINVEVTFPDDYHNTSLAGKDALFVTTINFIESEPIKPDFTDEFVMENLNAEYGWTTVDDVRAHVKDELVQNAKASYISEYIVTNSTISSVPDVVYRFKVNDMLAYYARYAANYSMSLEDFIISYIGETSMESLVDNNKETNMQDAKLDLVVQAIAQDMKISINDQDIEKYFSDNGENSSTYIEQLGKGYVAYSILFNKIFDTLYDQAVYEDSTLN